MLPASRDETHFGDRSALIGLLDRSNDSPNVCIVLDLGDLHRAERVARTLGPAYTNGLVRSVEGLIGDIVGSGARLFAIDIDCYALLLPAEDDAEWHASLRLLFERLRQPLDGDGLPGMVAPSAGIIRLDGVVATGEALLHAAVVAAQIARARDIPWVVGDIGGEVAYQRLHGVLAGLKSALTAPDQLSLVYQPRIDLRTGVCLGVEALLRWAHPVLGNVPPAEFIPVAEQTGLVGLITEWVMERALSDLSAWVADGYRHGVSINVSALNLAEPDFAQRLRASITRHAVNPTMLELEFTEDALIRNSEQVRATVADIAAAGIGIAIDDFGTGYSNLLYLREIPATSLKIDQSFIRTLNSSKRDQIIVRSMIGLAHQLGYRVIAEGVETSETRTILAEWGCDEAQGYHISRPIPIDAMRAWLAAGR